MMDGNSKPKETRRPSQLNQPKMWRASAFCCGAMPITAGFVVALEGASDVDLALHLG